MIDLIFNVALFVYLFSIIGASLGVYLDSKKVKVVTLFDLFVAVVSVVCPIFNTVLACITITEKSKKIVVWQRHKG